MSPFEPESPLQAIGLGQLASRFSETARLTRIDLDEWIPDAPTRVRLRDDRGRSVRTRDGSEALASHLMSDL